MTENQQQVVDQQIENERAARVAAADAIGAVFAWAYRRGKGVSQKRRYSSVAIRRGVDCAVRRARRRLGARRPIG